MSQTRSSTKRMAQAHSNEIRNFKKGLLDLEKSDTPVITELSTMFKELSQLPGFRELQQKLSSEGRELAETIFGIRQDLPKILSGYPPEIAKMIFKEVNPIDLFNLACVSKASKAFVEKLSIKLESITVMNTEEKWRRVPLPYFTFKFDMGNERKMTIEVKTSRDGLKESRDNNDLREFGGVQFALEYSWRDEYSFHCKDVASTEQLSRIICSFFFKAYRTRSVSLTVDKDVGKKFMFYFVNNITTNFHDFKYEDKRNRLTFKENRFLMERLNVAGTFVYESFGPNFKYDKPFPYRRMKTNMKWTLRNILDMKCESLMAPRSYGKLEDWNAIMEHWKNGGIAQLENLHLGCLPDNKNGEGFMGVTQWHPPLIDLVVHGEPAIRFRKSWYIRSNTGILAFVSSSNSYCQLFVCHDEFFEQNLETPDWANGYVWT